MADGRAAVAACAWRVPEGLLILVCFALWTKPTKILHLIMRRRPHGCSWIMFWIGCFSLGFFVGPCEPQLSRETSRTGAGCGADHFGSSGRPKTLSHCGFNLFLCHALRVCYRNAVLRHVKTQQRREFCLSEGLQKGQHKGSLVFVTLFSSVFFTMLEHWALESCKFVSLTIRHMCSRL